MVCQACGNECQRNSNAQRFCKPCRAERDKLSSQRSYSANAWRYKEAQKLYRERRKDSIAAYARRRHAEDAERRNAYTREWRKQNPEYERERRAKKPELIRGKLQRRRARLRNAFQDGTAEMAIKRLLGTPCEYCGQPGEHIDHKIPLARGGTHTAGNLVSACAQCNWRKGTRTDTEFRLLTTVSSSATL